MLLFSRIFKVLLILCLCAASRPSWAVNIFPLEPPDTSSPRATLNSFIYYTDQLHAAAVSSKEDARLEKEFLQRAVGCFDLSQVPSTLRTEIGIESVLMLREILDRTQLPKMADVPDRQEAKQQDILAWWIPHTEITIGRVAEGPRRGLYLFTSETVKSLENFYWEVRDVPYRQDKEEGYTGLYEQYIYSSGWMIPDGLLKKLPEWMRTGLHGQAVWQWIGLFFVLGAFLVVVLLMGRWHMRDWRKAGAKESGLLRLVFPCTSMLLCLAVNYIADTQVNITGDILRYLTVGLGVAFALFCTMAIYISGDLVMHGIIRSTNIKEEALDADVIKLVCTLFTFGLIFLLLYKVGSHFGIPVTAIFASAGIAGVAVALAARETLANFFGGISIFLDRPFRAGDYIVLSSGERGEVKAVGMRSTRLLTRDDIMITIPNSVITNGKVTNQSLPSPSVRVKIKVGVAYGTDIDKVESILLEIAAHNEMAMPAPEPRVRFRALGDSTLDFELLCWASRPQDRGLLIHQLNRAIYLKFGQEGIDIPFPQMGVHIHKG
ncbi:MAG: mechanosensitive ion channel family protein [Desulfobulbus sp.]